MRLKYEEDPNAVKNGPSAHLLANSPGGLSSRSKTPSPKKSKSRFGLGSSAANLFHGSPVRSFLSSPLRMRSPAILSKMVGGSGSPKKLNQARRESSRLLLEDAARISHPQIVVGDDNDEQDEHREHDDEGKDIKKGHDVNATKSPRASLVSVSPKPSQTAKMSGLGSFLYSSSFLGGNGTNSAKKAKRGRDSGGLVLGDEDDEDVDGDADFHRRGSSMDQEQRQAKSPERNKDEQRNQNDHLALRATSTSHETNFPPCVGAQELHQQSARKAGRTQSADSIVPDSLISSRSTTSVAKGSKGPPAASTRRSTFGFYLPRASTSTRRLRSTRRRRSSNCFSIPSDAEGEADEEDLSVEQKKQPLSARSVRPPTTFLSTKQESGKNLLEPVVVGSGYTVRVLTPNTVDRNRLSQMNGTTATENIVNNKVTPVMRSEVADDEELPTYENAPSFAQYVKAGSSRLLLGSGNNINATTTIAPEQDASVILTACPSPSRARNENGIRKRDCVRRCFGRICGSREQGPIEDD
ncbi:unnamed protein product [Amoebophrya sp. A25]|nr:unnamed protein product [Amoebophrya sp. A25]|eukprot:GSA25T00020793001.1